MKRRKKVLVAMSGGVDSSVSAHLLKKKGYDVAGVTMCFGVKEAKKTKPSCCSKTAIDDAKKVCRKLNIPHYVLDFSKDLEKDIINPFVSEYKKGRTPNPCVECNGKIKFSRLYKKAMQLGFDYLATGHYAKVVKKNEKAVLKKARDRKKDQSYFLYPIKKDVLNSVIFPLGGFTKDEVREIARKHKLPVAEKAESQDLCFIPDRNYHSFLEERLGRMPKGNIITIEGKLVGSHKGAAFYTIGQRGGLGIGHAHPLYVLGINIGKNELIVGKRDDLKAKGLIAKDVNFLVDDVPRRAKAKIRYNHKGAECAIYPVASKARVMFDKPQEAITPGQSVVFYRRNTVIGGGVIDRVIRK